MDPWIRARTSRKVLLSWNVRAPEASRVVGMVLGVALPEGVPVLPPAEVITRTWKE